MPISKINTTSITDNSVTAGKIVAGAVSTAKIADSAVNSAKIGVDVIAAEDLAANSITVSEISNGAVTTDKLADNAVTADKLADAINSSIAAKMPLSGGSFTGNLGVGETSPDRALHVNSATTNVVAKFESTDTTAAIEFTDSSGSAEVGTHGGNVVFYPSGTEKVRMSTDGNLLVGTTTNPNTSGSVVIKQGNSNLVSLIYPLVAGGNSSTTVTLDLASVLGIVNVTNCVIEITAGGYGNSQSGNFAYKGLRVGYTNGAQYQNIHQILNSVTNGSISVGSGANTVTITLNNTNGNGKLGHVRFDVLF